MKPGIKAQVKTCVRDFNQTVQTVQIYVQIPPAFSRKVVNA